MNRLGTTRLPQIYLNPGEIVVAEGPVVVTTVLGSCVAVTLYSPQTRYSAICHGVLPSGSGSSKEPGRYVDQAIRYMLNFFRLREVANSQLAVKIFGGADMFSRTTELGVRQTIGRKNVEAALAELQLVGLRPQVTEVGGSLGRKLVFRAHTGEVFLKKVQKEQLSSAERLLRDKFHL